ncbi:MAG: fructose-6-phosphate aldolase [Deltaproteobacteria bacterium]|jgi:transaldolase|nr:fructose-6-phosphate aldolase [Deltaproteobacteria bacterium]
MQLFIDTANLDEIRKASSYGVLDGVTTNPSLMAKEGISDQEKRIVEICGIVAGPVSAEVIATDADGMIKEAKKLAALAKNVAVKLPLTLPGLEATRTLADEGVDINLTLVFSPVQALLAAKAGAKYVSPFVGRLDDIGQDGMALVEDIIDIYGQYSYDTEIIVASVRSPLHVANAALLGADICTIPFKIITQLVAHPLTDKGLAAFLEDYRKIKSVVH